MIKSIWLGLVASLACAHAAMAAPSFITAWAASPQPFVGADPPHFSNQTLRQVVRISAGGAEVRIRLSNEYGSAPLKIGEVHVALAGTDGAIVAGSDHVVTFAGARSAAIPSGAPLVSDPIALKVAALSSLAVSLYLPADSGACSCHRSGLATGYASGPGNFAGDTQLPAKSTFTFRAFLSGVDVAPDRPGQGIVVFGDSLSDGAVSTLDRNQRWPDRLAERLVARDGDRRPWGVANEGISGNRLLSDGSSPNALGRFDRDVLSQPGAAYLVLFEGVNDLGGALGPAAASTNPLSAPDIIAAYRQIITRARARGLKVIGATLTPYGGASYWSPAGDAERVKINQWIRTGGAFDGVIDFDAVWRDPADPARIRADFAAKDHLHGTDAGYRALGDAVDLNLFK